MGKDDAGLKGQGSEQKSTNSLTAKAGIESQNRQDHTEQRDDCWVQRRAYKVVHPRAVSIATPFKSV